MKAWVALAAVAVLAAGCWEDRARPAPLEPDGVTGLSVEVVRPLANAVVLAGRPLEVEVAARDEVGRLVIGLGYVARRVQGGQTVDSAAVRFEARTAARDTFELAVPGDLPTNSNLAITGLAFRGNSLVRLSPVTLVVVAQCGPGVPGCD